MNKTNSKGKALIYCRVSSRSQETEGHGLESQETRCRQYAQAQGLEVAAVFPDTMTGGGGFMKRPGMVAMLSFIDAQPDEQFTVIFDDLKRASRDTRAFLDLRDAFRIRGVGVTCLNFKFDETPEGEFIETIMAAQGALERKQNGRQVAQKMRARMESGFWVHQAPIGYRYETQRGRGKVLIPNPPLDGIIREALEGYATGRFGSQAEVKRFLEGFPDFPRTKQGEVRQQEVTRILTRSLYAGFICSETYGISWLKAQHEPLISIETFEKVQERRTGVSRAPKRKNIGRDFAFLRGMVACGGCKAPLRSSWSKGKMGKKYAYYHCQTKGCSAYGKSIPKDRVEGDVGALLKTLEPTPGLLALARAMFRRAWDNRADLAKDAQATARAQIGADDKQIQSLLDRILTSNNASVIGTYEDKIAQLERQKAVLAEQAEKHTIPHGTFEEKLEPLLQFLANPWKLWETGQVELRRLTLKLAFAGRLEYTRNEGPRTPELALPFKALGVFEGGEMVSGGA
ncbi:MAG: recombinase family protein [Pseudomonadota bacterium]